MVTITELKNHIQKCDREKKAILFYPELTFVGNIGDKTHIGRVHLHIDPKGRLGLCCSHVYCGSKKWGGRTPNASNLTGKALVTCQRCSSTPSMLDLNVRNKEYLHIIPLIGKVI